MTHSQLPGSVLIVTAACLMLGSARISTATTLVVPDHSASIQAALAAGPDTVLIRAGIYREQLTIRDGVALRALVAGEPDSRPEVDGVLLDFSVHAPSSRPVLIEAIAIRGNARVVNESTPIDITFRSCRLDSGLAATGLDTWTLRVAHCIVTGRLELAGRSVIADSNLIQGGVTLRAETVRMRGNSIQGSAGTAIRGLDATLYRQEIVGNKIAGFEQGIALRSDHIDVSRNAISGCAGTAVEAEVFSSLKIAGNTVLACEGGLALQGGSAVVDSNIVLGASLHGIHLQNSDGPAAIRGNVVGRCGGDGIVLANVFTANVDGNTCFLNTRHGIEMPGVVEGTFARNIGYQNGGAGARVSPGITPVCNDWFENSQGGVISGQPSLSDLSVDPQFCDLAKNDLRLSVTSPLLDAAGCGRIGALDEGCGFPTSARLTQFTAAATAEGVEVRWHVVDTASGFVAWLERGDSDDGPWSLVEGDRSSEGEVIIELDRAALPGRRYWYRLLATEVGQTRVLGPPIEVVTARTLRFELGRTGPNPASGPMEIEFQLAEPAEIELELFDLQGRRVAQLARGTWASGSHLVTWAWGRHAGAGVYLLRYRYPGGEARRRIVLTR